MSSTLRTTYTCGHFSLPFSNKVSSYPPPRTLDHPCRPCHWEDTNRRAIDIEESYTPILSALDGTIASSKEQLALAEAEVQGGAGVMKGVLMDLRHAGGERIIGWPEGSRGREWARKLESAKDKKRQMDDDMRENVVEVWKGYYDIWAEGRSLGGGV